MKSLRKYNQTYGLTFDDVLLYPNYTQVKRQDIDISTNLTKKIKLSIPLLSAPMDSVTESKMAIALGKLGGLGVIHRNFSVEDQTKEVKKTKKEIDLVAAAVGVGKDLQERVRQLDKAGVNIVVIDSAHGFSKWVIEATSYISGKYKHIAVISGNIGTAEGAHALAKAGADVLRVGMGPGSICTTRVVAGVGMPQLTAIVNAATVAQKHGIPVVADGGLTNSGDIVKALAAGALVVMSGSLFAGCDETPGKIVTIKGKKYKSYRGMGSIAAMKEGSAARYGQDYRRGQEKKLIAEGVAGMVSYKGLVEKVVNQLIGGLRAGMYYVGARNIKQLQERAQFIQVTSASQLESHPHNIIVNSK